MPVTDPMSGVPVGEGGGGEAEERADKCWRCGAGEREGSRREGAGLAKSYITPVTNLIMPVVAHHSVCPECHELAADDSAPVRSQEPDVLLRTQDSDTNVSANETGCGADERAEGSPETSEPLPDASQPVPIESRPLQQSHAVQSYAEAGVAESSMPPLTNSTGTCSFTSAVSCMLATPPTSTLPENGIEGAHGDGCGVAASLISRRTETILKHRHADIRPRDRNERYEQVNMRYEDVSDDDAMPDEGEDVVPNPILEVGRRRVPSVGRGCLFPGSLFRGKQTSGRSSYDVEVRILDVSFPTSTISGYLSISHLTETHPRLTTFFSGEIIGSTYGFLTGPAFYSAQATESDDMRHWSRFEHFQKVKGELKRPGLTMRDEGSISLGQGVDQEKPFCFMRWKERFLVPDHKVRDISGASFAGE
ncbi:hypothetical protein QFC21_004817 [Naganishia friedmannii]|uniref:Uncharacterized protein n=1 Tax=Naganishia friedmannii TaxID=89922 RepID=A0ACC2VCN9_9TREE|nr:hypothetical protein QFC21_004817 [Naganishia friedmannii]